MCLPEECSVVRGCKARETALLKRIFEASGESWRVEQYRQEADFQVAQLTPDDWVEISRVNKEESDAKWADCVGDSIINHIVADGVRCSQETLLVLMNKEDSNARIPGDLGDLARQLENSTLGGISRLLIQSQLLHSQRRVLGHLKTVADLCIAKNCTQVFSQRISTMEDDIMSTIRSIKPMFARNLQVSQALFLARFMMRQCRGFKDDPWRMCWPEVAMKWLAEIDHPNANQIDFQIRSLTVSKSNQSDQFFGDLMTDVTAPTSLCFWSACPEDEDRALRIVEALGEYFLYIITEQQVSDVESLAKSCRIGCFVIWGVSDRLQTYQLSRKFLQFMHLRYLRALCESNACIAAVQEAQEMMSSRNDFLRFFVPNVYAELFNIQTRLDAVTLISGLTFNAVCILLSIVTLIFGRNLWKYQKMMVFVGFSIILWCSLSIAAICLFGFSPHLSTSLNYFPSVEEAIAIRLVLVWSMGVIGILQLFVFSVFLQQWIEALLELSKWSYHRVGQVSRIVLICLNLGSIITVLILLIYWTSQKSIIIKAYDGSEVLFKTVVVLSFVSLALVFCTCVCCCVGLVFLFRRKLNYRAILGSLGLFLAVLLGQVLRVLYYFADSMYETRGMTPLLHHGVGLFLISIPLCVFVIGAEIALRKRVAVVESDLDLSGDSNSVPLIPKAYENY